MAESILKVCARNIRKLRHEKSWSQEMLAEKAGVHRTYLGAIERGERNFTLTNLDKIARALGSTASDLLKGE